MVVVGDPLGVGPCVPAPFLLLAREPNILLRRAQRLRKLTGNQRLKSQSEIDPSNLTFG